MRINFVNPASKRDAADTSSRRDGSDEGHNIRF